jgi:hypothetical protein
VDGKRCPEKLQPFTSVAFCHKLSVGWSQGISGNDIYRENVALVSNVF